jgi:hypothetical protein
VSEKAFKIGATDAAVFAFIGAAPHWLVRGTRRRGTSAFAPGVL